MSGVLLTTHGILGGNASADTPTLDLSGLSTPPKFWLDMSGLNNATLTAENYAIAIPNKGTFVGDWIGSNALGSVLPTVRQDAGDNYLQFNSHGAKMQIGTPADARFLHTNTPHLHLSVAAVAGSGEPLYSTVAWDDGSGIGVFLFAGFWGSSWNNSLVKGWKNPGLSWVGALSEENVMPITNPATYRVVTSVMRGWNVVGRNKWEALINGSNTPAPGNYSNSFDSHMAGLENTDPSRPFTIGLLGDSGDSYIGMNLKQSITIPYPGTPSQATIDSDITYALNQITDFYPSIY